MHGSEVLLPQYQKPPVVEVALSVQFAEIAALRNVHLGLLWNRYRETYPRTEEHAPLADVTETFQAERRQVGVVIESSETPPVPRLWCVNREGNRLIQLQTSRLIHNWRMRAGDERYPHYPEIRSQFVDAFGKFHAFLAEEGLGSPSINQCEVTYVNHIEASGWSHHGDADAVVSPFRREFSDGFLASPEDVTMALRFRIRNQAGEDRGRLHIRLEPAFRTSDNQPIFILTLTSRGRPASAGLESALEFLDLGREWIVRGFTSVTTQDMHKRWERTQ